MDLKLWQKILLQTALWAVKTFIIKKISPELRELLKKGVSLADDVAKKTTNTVDDFVVNQLKELLQ